MNDNTNPGASDDPTSEEHQSDGLTLVETASQRGFNYPYYLLVPGRITDEQRPILVEAHNVGEQLEEFDRQLLVILLDPDAWTDPELRATEVLTYDESIREERSPRSEEAYVEADVGAVFRTDDGVGHTPEQVLDEVVAFDEQSLAGDDIESIREAFV